jgi:putative hydrolase of the HAD superfamily
MTPAAGGVRAVLFDLYETLVTLFRSPVYFGEQMAADAGVDARDFQALWDQTETARTLGAMTMEQALALVLSQLGRDSTALLDLIARKRAAAKVACFSHLHPEILPLLDALKQRGVRIGLVSNCFSEEASALRGSALFPYFDAACLSCEEGVQKPDAEIFKRCLSRLGYEAGDCLYVGDGGSRELEAARDLGMQTAQAIWYLKEGWTWPASRKESFRQLEEPMELLRYI